MLEGSILKKLVDERTDQGQTPLNFGVYYKNTLVALCHALEDCILTSDSSPLVITAFQRGKWYLEEADHYGELAPRAEQIVIMAAPEAGFHQHPTSQYANVALVDLDPHDPVAQEWHLIILSPDYSAMVLCQELSLQDYGPQGPPSNDLERKFYGFWTFEPALVAGTIELAIDHIGHYQPQLQVQLSQILERLQTQNPRLQLEPPALDLGNTVTQVVNYLQRSRTSLLSNQALHLVEDLNQNLVSNELQAFLRMAQLVDLSDPVNPLASSEVVALLEMMGQLLNLPAWQLKRLQLAGMLYRIAPLSQEVAASDGPSCPLVSGVQALRIMPRLRAVATIIAHRLEAWDGSGHPAGLAGDAIPLESRMLGLVVTFQQTLAELKQANADGETLTAEPMELALQVCQAGQGETWDPKLVDMLSLMVRGLQQGLSLPSLPRRVTLGVGLLNPEVEAVEALAPDVPDLSAEDRGTGACL